MRKVVSKQLRYGVIVAATITFLGGILFFIIPEDKKSDEQIHRNPDKIVAEPVHDWVFQKGSYTLISALFFSF